MTFLHRHASLFSYAGLVLIIALFDGFACGHFSAWVLYFVPIGLATWNLGAAKGGAFAGLAVALQMLLVGLHGNPLPSTLYMVVSLTSNAIAFAILVGLVGALRKKNVGRVYLPRRGQADGGEFLSTGFMG